MESEVKQRNQRNRRRERAQRMQAQRESKVKDGDSGEEESPARDKPPRPPTRRKKSKEPLGEEDIIDGFAIMAFRTYEDLEAAVKCATLPRTEALTTKPRLPDAPKNHPSITSTVTSHSLTLLQDAGTSDDSGRASERLTGSSVAPRDPDSSRDRLSDASSRCSSGKGYICDSEGDDDKASPENSRNTSPRYHDASMEDVSEAGALFRVTGSSTVAGGAGGKSELVARGGSGGALALSRAPVGGSASPAPAPLPQPAPSPAPAALPPPALPPPTFRADTPHRNNGAHIPTLDGHAATQIPARPVGAAGPDTPERPASNNKLQPGARAAADSPTPAPPAPPAPSPLFPSHTAYQSHAAAALPDYRHTNHETRTDPVDQPPAPLDLHSAKSAHITANSAQSPHPSLPNRIQHAHVHPVLPGHDVRNAPLVPPNSSVPTSYPNRVNGAPPSASPLSSAPSPMSSCLPSQTHAGRPVSPVAPSSRPYPVPSIGSSHVNSSMSPSIHNHSIAFQSQSSLQKHSVQSIYANRPSHLAPFSIANHISSNHLPPPSTNQTTATHLSQPINSHSMTNHSSHPGLNHPLSVLSGTPNHIGLPAVSSTSSNTIPSYTSSLKHPGLSLSQHNTAANMPPSSLSTSSNHMDVSQSVNAPAIITTSAVIGNSHPGHHMMPPIIDSRQAPVIDSRQPPPPVVDSRQPPLMDSRQPSVIDSRQPSVIDPKSTSSVDSKPTVMDSRQPPIIDSRQPPMIDSRPPSRQDSRSHAGLDSRHPSVLDSRSAPASSSETPVRTEVSSVSTLAAANGFPPPAVYSGAPYPPLYAPYAATLQHSPYLPPAAASPRNTSDARTSLSASPLVAPKTPKGVRPHTPGSTGCAAPHAPLSYSPRGHSPTRERESFSSTVSSLSRSTPASAASAPVSAAALPPPPLAAPLVAPLAAPLTAPLAAPLAPPLAAPLATGLNAPLTAGVGGLPLAAPTATPAAPTPHLAHTLAPVPTVPSISSSAKPPAHWGVTRAGAERPTGFSGAPPLFGAPLPPPNHNPFSAESLFQTSPGADLLRRELDNRFLAAAGAAGAGGPGGARTEMHHHQHQHTHVHAHPHHAPHPAPPPHPHHAPPHHHHLLMPHAPLFKDVSKMSSLYRTGLSLGYPYSSSLLHPTAPYVPPAPLTTYAPKPVVSAASDPATKPTLRPPTKTGKWNAMHVRIAWEIYNHQQKEKAGGAAPQPDKDKLRTFPAPAPPPPFRSPYDLPPAPYLSHHPHLGMSPFARYGAGAFPGAPTPFGLSAYGRELALSSPLHGVHHAPPLGLHDAWRLRPPAPAPPPVSAVAAAEARRDHEERERARRERDERERRDREERERRKQRERDLERQRARSPLRNGVPEPPKEERKDSVRPAASLPAYPPPPWDPYRTFDPLQHMRFAPLVEAAIRAEEDRAKMLSAYAHHQQLKSSPLLHRPLPPHAPLPPLAPHAPLAPLPPLAPPLAPLAPLDLLKKEEPR